MIVADSNILSSFAAAKGLPLLFKALQEEVIYEGIANGERETGFD